MPKNPPKKPAKKKPLKEFEYKIIDARHKGDTKVAAFEKFCSKTGNPNRQVLSNRATQFFNREDVRAEILRIETKAFERSCITKEYVLGTVKEVIERCMQHAPVLNKSGEQVYVEGEGGEMVPAYVFKEMGALKGCDMLMKQQGLYEADNAQKNVTKEVIKDMSPEAKQDLIKQLKAADERARETAGSQLDGRADSGAEGGITH